ncbi:exported hypothetical protein [uncultured Eubacteriales bacterium]|uniref:WG repeat-containing protein n=1 Tax=uncultured Eubacteriales bacterium TaxID=172733 RepID=A0A212KF29_9FIRM|nr:exported hypothetical protein [uncultured Eubacteriales bacterium]
MRKKLLSSLLCLCVLLSCAPIASAAQKDSFTDGDYTFQKADIAVSGLGNSHALLVDSSKGLRPEDNAYFSDGMLLLYDYKSNTYTYLGDDGKIHDLNQGRFISMCPFSEGLAAVVDKNEKMGFIDTTGKLVIPCQFETPINQVFSPYGSYFRNGTAWVFRYAEGYDMGIGIFMGDSMPGTFTKIDTAGKLIPGTEEDVSMRWSGPESKEISTYGIFCPGGSARGVTGFTEECNAPGLGTFKARFGTSDTGLVQLPTGTKDEYGNAETQLYVVTRKAKSPITLSVMDKDAVLVDNGYVYDYTITNNTATDIKGYYALVNYSARMSRLASGREHFVGQVHRFELDLAAGESISGAMKSQTGGLSTQGMIWVTFENKAEQDSFFANRQIGESSDPSTSDISFGYYYIESETFMKDTFGITILPAK